MILFAGAAAAIAIPAFVKYQQKARMAEAKANVGDIRTVQLAYYDDDMGGDGAFANSLEALGWTLPNGKTASGPPCFWRYSANEDKAWAETWNLRKCGALKIEINLINGSLNIQR